MAAPPLGISARVTVEERVRLQASLRYAPAAAGSGGGDPCLLWTAGNRVRFRGKYWLPHRLLYSIAGPANAAAGMKRARLERTCSTAGCVQPRHQTILPYEPPRKQKKKRVATAVAASGSDEDLMLTGLLRAEILKLQRTLALIDAANGDADAEQAALQAATGLTSDIVELPADPAERAALLALERDPFSMFRQQLGMP